MVSEVLPTEAANPAQITPGLQLPDKAAAYWFAQVNLRLRREVAWCWHQRMQSPPLEGVLPPVTDATADALDRVRFAGQRQQFFATDVAAAYLSEQLQQLAAPDDNRGGSRWQWCAGQYHLSRAEQFVLALGMAMQLDAGLAPVCATCANDLSRPYPTLALAQRLWDSPQDIIPCANPNHRLFRAGLLRSPADNQCQQWQLPLEMPAAVAQQLLDPAAALPDGLRKVRAADRRPLRRAEQLLVNQLSQAAGQPRIVPLVGAGGVDYEACALGLNSALGRGLLALDYVPARDPRQLKALAAVAWLRQCDLILPAQWLAGDGAAESNRERLAPLAELAALPLRWYLPLSDGKQQHAIPDHLRTPACTIDSLDFQQRVALWQQYLQTDGEDLQLAIEDCARRFRFEQKTVESVARSLLHDGQPVTEERLRAACANEAAAEMGHLAQRVQPRFAVEEVVLPVDRRRQFGDILHAMAALTLVHYRWGTATAWNESGLSALFCGPPGTGKTMAAEALSKALSLPMYRIDLSQVVNKYIGETEKNLRRIFDAAELSDCILFFDEADALFGKRTEVKDAHDRFANIEISYLLERMERFKGLAILATNRRKDLDEAFMRRLRYIIEFPVPGEDERRQIWQQVFPQAVDTSDLDIRFLAKRFPLAGGHIRSVAFNACLRAADRDRPRQPARVAMADVVIAVKRELEKVDRSAGRELFGQYQHLLPDEEAQ